MVNNNLEAGEVMVKMVAKLKQLAQERHNLNIEDVDPLYRANRADELVWQMAGIANSLIDMEDELEKFYPELIPFLQFMVRNYPNMKYKGQL